LVRKHVPPNIFDLELFFKVTGRFKVAIFEGLTSKPKKIEMSGFHSKVA